MRHENKQASFRWLMLAVALIWMAPLSAQTLQQGQHYVAVDAPASLPTDRVVVTEAFAYLCPACRNFLPVMSQWSARQPEYVQVEHLPVALQPGWDVFVRAYYTMQALDLPQAAHEALFIALHDQRRTVRNIADIGALLSDYGTDAAQFAATAESFAVESMVGRNRNEIRRYGVRSTPSLIVHGKWRMNLNAFNSYEEMMAAVDVLVAREAAAMGLGTDAEQ